MHLQSSWVGIPTPILLAGKGGLLDLSALSTGNSAQQLYSQATGLLTASPGEDVQREPAEDPGAVLFHKEQNSAGQPVSRSHASRGFLWQPRRSAAGAPGDQEMAELQEV